MSTESKKTAEEILKEQWARMTQEERLEMMYRDPITFALNERAFRDTPTPADRPWVAIISVEGTSYVKNELGPTARDMLLRYVGQALIKLDLEVFAVSWNIRVKEYPDFDGQFAIFLKDASDLPSILERGQSELPEKLNLNGTVVRGGPVFKLSGVVGTEVLWPEWMKRNEA